MNTTQALFAFNLCFYMYATCFSLFLGQHQTSQLKKTYKGK